MDARVESSQDALVKARQAKLLREEERFRLESYVEDEQEVVGQDS